MLMTTLPIDSATPVDHRSVNAGDLVGCVLTQSKTFAVVWYGPWTVVANDRDADVIVVRQVETGEYDSFAEGDEIIAWPSA